MDDQPLKQLLKSQPANPQVFPRKSKHAPKELPSNKPVGRHKRVEFFKPGEDPDKGVFVKKRKGRDPRFEKHAGKFNQDMFDKAYAFINEYREEELAELQTALAQKGSEQLVALVAKKKQELERVKMQKRTQKVKRSLYAQEREKVKQGKKPFYFNKKLIRMRAMQEKMQELKESGGLRKYLKKKRKREQSREAAAVYRTTKKFKSTT